MQTNLYRGAAVLLLAEIFMVISGMIIRQIELPTAMIVFLRSLFGLSLLLPWLARNGSQAIKTDKLRFHLIRGGLGIVAMTCLYYTFIELPLAQATLLKQTAPFFMPFIGFWWLGERIGKAVCVAVVFGFIGVYLILNPGEGAINLAVLAGLAGAILGSVAKVTIRRMSDTEPARRIVFYLVLFGSLFSCLPAIWYWQNPTITQWLMLFALGATATTAQLCVSKAYGLAPAGQLGPFTYGSVVFAAVAGWWVWDEMLSLQAWLGVLIVCVAGALTMLTRQQSASGVKAS